MSARAPIFDVQTLGTRDGPGLRTVVFLKGCPLRCSWCSNPEGQSAAPSLRWHGSRCQGCLTCAASCPARAVSLSPEGWPRFDRSRCVSCSDKPCIARCPAGALDRVGRDWTADELFELVRRDIRLYWNSGGGVTFSGGEPLLYPALMAEVAGRLARLGVETAVETAGLWRWDDVADALEACALIYFDVKALDDELHRQLTGCSNQQILANLARLSQAHPDRVCVSLPLIPGALDSPARLDEVGLYLRGLGVSRVRLLPYHRLGEGKYEALGLDLPAEPGPAALSPSLISEIHAALRALGLAISVEE